MWYIKMRYNLVFLFFLSLGFNAKAQSNVSSYVQSLLILVSEDDQGKAIEFSVNNSYMLLNISTGDLVLSANLSEIKTGNKVTDSLIASQGDQQLSFKGNIGQNVSIFSRQQNDSKIYSFQGTFLLNGNSFTCISEFDPIYLADKSESKNYRMDFKLSLDPDKVKIKGLENRFVKEVVFEIRSGKVNVQQ